MYTSTFASHGAMPMPLACDAAATSTSTMEIQLAAGHGPPPAAEWPPPPGLPASGFSSPVVPWCGGGRWRFPRPLLSSEKLETFFFFCPLVLFLLRALSPSSISQVTHKATRIQTKALHIHLQHGGTAGHRFSSSARRVINQSNN